MWNREKRTENEKKMLRKQEDRLMSNNLYEINSQQIPIPVTSKPINNLTDDEDPLKNRGISKKC